MKSMILKFVCIGIFLVLAGCSSPQPAGPASTAPADQSPAATSPAEATNPPAAGQAATAPSSDIKNLAETACSACHSFDRVSSSHMTADEWVTTVDRMVGKGAALTTDQAAAVAAYLAQTYK
jgi:mono/diheme cytochrome c family protein